MNVAFGGPLFVKRVACMTKFFARFDLPRWIASFRGDAIETPEEDRIVRLVGTSRLRPLQLLPLHLSHLSEQQLRTLRGRVRWLVEDLRRIRSTGQLGPADLPSADFNLTFGSLKLRWFPPILWIVVKIARRGIFWDQAPELVEEGHRPANSLAHYAPPTRSIIVYNALHFWMVANLCYFRLYPVGTDQFEDRTFKWLSERETLYNAILILTTLHTLHTAYMHLKTFNFLERLDSRMQMGETIIWLIDQAHHKKKAPHSARNQLQNTAFIAGRRRALRIA